MKILLRTCGILALPVLAAVCVFTLQRTNAGEPMKEKAARKVSDAPIQVTFVRDANGKGVDVAVRDCGKLREKLQNYTYDKASWEKMTFNDEEVKESGAAGAPTEPCVKTGKPAEPTPSATPHGASVKIAQSAGFASTADLSKFLNALSIKESSKQKAKAKP